MIMNTMGRGMEQMWDGLEVGEHGVSVAERMD
jgi:hypothetical protein